MITVCLVDSESALKDNLLVFAPAQVTAVTNHMDSQL